MTQTPDAEGPMHIGPIGHDDLPPEHAAAGVYASELLEVRGDTTPVLVALGAVIVSLAALVLSIIAIVD